jgi:hypothetical protein
MVSNILHFQGSRLYETYVINKEEVCELYRNEASVLGRIFDASGSENIKLLARQFLHAREFRHVRLKEILSKEEYSMLKDFEQYYEKLEGTATYINIKIAELLGDTDLFARYKDSVSREFNGTKKFYNTGAGMCYMLDKLGFPWKEDIFRQQLSLEQIIRQSLEGSY